MEFFKVIPVSTTEAELQKQLALSNLENFSNQIFGLGQLNETEINTGGLWGEFTLTCQKIKGGVRFTLLECPNALCWTVTTGYPPERASIILHLTINRIQKQAEFVEEIEEFLEDHVICLQELFSN